jgi:hypothetical protein
MEINNLTADNTNITSIQLNLFDCCDEKPDFNELLNNKITGHTNLDLENGVILTSPNHFEFDTRRCPKCGKFALIKKKFVPRKVILNKIGDVIFYLKEYFCKKCHSYPKVELKNILKERTKVSILFLENMYNKARTGIKSLRNTSKDLEFDDITLSHQSVSNHLTVKSVSELTFDVEELSGYFGYDEQFVKIGKKHFPKAQLVDLVSNQTIAIKILDKVTSENVENFIKDHTTKSKRICLVTDHDNTYLSVIKKLGFNKHQLCLFHFLEIIDKKVKEIIKENDFNDAEVEELNNYASRIKSIFLANNVKEFIYRLNKFFKQWNNVPEDLKHFYNKKVVKDMHKLTHHLFDPQIPRTNNQLEGKFSGAQQQYDKKRFKTIEGCLTYLKPITERQNEELKREKNQEKEDNIELKKSIKQLFER